MLGGPKEVMGEVLLQKKWLALAYYLLSEDRSLAAVAAVDNWNKNIWRSRAPTVHSVKPRRQQH